MPRLRARQYPRPLPDLQAGPFAGCTDDRAPGAAQAARVRVARNVYREAGPASVRYVGRPGFATAGAISPAGAAAGQWVGQFTKANGTTYTIRIIGGRLETYDWGADAWTEVVTAANLATASITLSATARVHTVALADTLIVSDGVNKPWSWDGTSGASGLTSLTNCPVLFGPITVYYAKLFGIKATERNTIVWSEENQPNLGYEAGGYNNAWSPLGAASFTSLAATNEALFVAQARRIVRITGAVSTDFQTSGTLSDVSESVGAVGPMIVIGATVYFVDADARPYAIPPGGVATPMWADCRETLRTMNPAALAAATLLHYSPADLLVIGLPAVGITTVRQRLIFALAGGTPSFLGVWDGYDEDAAGMVRDASGTPRLMHVGPGDGRAYLHGTPNGSHWNDAGAPIPHVLTTAAMGVAARTDKKWERVTLLTASETNMTLTLGLATPRGRQTSAPFTIVGTGDRLGSTFRLGASRLSAAAAELRTEIGVDLDGRWAECTLTHAALNERFGLVALDAVAFATSEDPTTP